MTLEEQVVKKEVTPITQEVKKEVVEVKKAEPTPIVTKKDIDLFSISFEFTL